MVPEGWGNKPLGTLLSKVIDYRGKSVPKSEKGVLLITARNVRDGYLDFVSKEFIAEEDYESWMSRDIPKCGDILFTTEAPLGMVCMFPSSGRYAIGQRTVTLRVNTSLISAEFLHYFLRSQQGQRLVDIRSTGSTAKGIKSSELKKVHVLYPKDVNEQTKIATILSTWDKAIETVEKLIENSRNQKKELMQQLLSGETRLPGFSKAWVTVQLKDIATIKTGTSKSQFIVDDGDYYILDMGSVSRDGKLTPTKKTKLNQDFLSTADLVMPKDDIGGGNILGRTGFVDQDGKYVLGDHVYHLTINNAHSLFIHFLINSCEVNKTLRRKANGTAQLGLGKKDIEKLSINIPPTIEEQVVIASLISNAEETIYLLHKYKQQLVMEKKALMQQLLTGKRRVKVTTQESTRGL